MDHGVGKLLTCLLLLTAAHAGFISESNLTSFLQHREKRMLIFPNSGTIKFSIGPSMPVPLGDPVTFRSLVCSYNLQGGQYPLPQTATYPWDKWEHLFARSLNQMRLKIAQTDEHGHTQYKDDSRLYVYAALENYMSRDAATAGYGQDVGRQCMLSAICGNAQVHHHAGIYAEIANIILTPGKARMPADYHEAYAAGKDGVDCLTTYPACPSSVNVFNRYLVDD